MKPMRELDYNIYDHYTKGNIYRGQDKETGYISDHIKVVWLGYIEPFIKEVNEILDFGDKNGYEYSAEITIRINK